jgi:hypothetical protein
MLGIKPTTLTSRLKEMKLTLATALAEGLCFG